MLSLAGPGLGITFIVSGLLGACLLLFILTHVFRRIFRLSKYRSTPLPPIQPLAHHRERRLLQFVDRIGNSSRTSLCYTHSQLIVPPALGPASGTGSDVSLLRGKNSAFSISSPTSPGPGFDTVDDAMGAYRSSALSDSPRPAQQVSPDTQSFPETPDSNTSACTHRTSSSRSRSIARPRPLTRPLSMISITSTDVTHRSDHTLRALPHGPYSVVRIVLPLPLSSSLPPSVNEERLHVRRHTTLDGVPVDRYGRRISVVDKWASLSVRSSYSKERRTSGYTDSQTPTSLRTNAEYSPSRNPSRARSFSLVTDVMSTRPYQTPPVPRIPSMYTPSDTNLFRRSEAHEPVYDPRDTGDVTSSPYSSSDHDTS